MAVPPRLVILGRQGAGKGTQGARLARHLSLHHLSTGDLLREAVRSRSRLGREVQSIIEAGELVPDDVMLKVVHSHLTRPEVVRQGYLLDGFPRTLAQAEQFEEVRPGELQAAIYLDISADLAFSRSANRRVCPACGWVTAAPDGVEAVACQNGDGLAVRRSDDSPTAIRRRLALYDAQTAPVLKWFAERNLLVRVDGTGPADEVFDRLRAAVRPALWGEGERVG